MRQHFSMSGHNFLMIRAGLPKECLIIVQIKPFQLDTHPVCFRRQVILSYSFSIHHHRSPLSTYIHTYYMYVSTYTIFIYFLSPSHWLGQSAKPELLLNSSCCQQCACPPNVGVAYQLFDMRAARSPSPSSSPLPSYASSLAFTLARKHCNSTDLLIDVYVRNWSLVQ